MSNEINVQDNEDFRIVEAVQTAIAKEAGFPMSEIDPDADLTSHPKIGACGFYKIIGNYSALRFF